MSVLLLALSLGVLLAVRLAAPELTPLGARARAASR
jgi:hypothetical protein